MFTFVPYLKGFKLNLFWGTGPLKFFSPNLNPAPASRICRHKPHPGHARSSRTQSVVSRDYWTTKTTVTTARYKNILKRIVCKNRTRTKPTVLFCFQITDEWLNDFLVFSPPFRSRSRVGISSWTRREFHFTFVFDPRKQRVAHTGFAAISCLKRVKIKKKFGFTSSSRPRRVTGWPS